MKKILTCDPGLRNLSICIMNSDYQILFWNTLDILNEDSFNCTGEFKNGKICGRKCSVKYKLDSQEIFSCKTHVPKGTISKIFKRKNIDKYRLQEIAVILIQKLETVDLSGLTEIYIELQPKCNPKILFVSHIIYAKFVEIFKDTIPIKFVRASQKLKIYKGPFIECKLKGKYAQRKWLSVEYCRWFLNNKFSIDQKEIWSPLFENKKIRADMSDTFLMCLNGLNGVDKKQLKHKNGNEISI